MSRSGGPRTLEGKQKSALNAIKHGAYVTKPILPGENKAEYEALYQDFFEVFKPEGVLEEMLAIQSINAMWAKARYANVEYVSLEKSAQSSDLSVQFGLTKFRYIDDSRAQKFMRHLYEFGDEKFAEMAHMYQVANDMNTSRDLSIKDINQLNAENPSFYCYLLAIAKDLFLKDISANQWLEKTLDHYGQETTYLHICLEKVLDDLRDADWFFGNLHHIRNEAKIYQSQRVMGFMQTLSHHRVKRDLQAAYSRAFNELMRVKQWKEDHRTVDVPNVLGGVKQSN